MLEWIQAHQFFIDITLISTLLVMSVFVVFHAGVFSLASVGFMAVGAYGTAILTTKSGFPIWLGIVAGVVCASVVALIVGLLVARLSGIYLALATFALAQAILVAIRELHVTNGVQGIIGIPIHAFTWTAVILLVLLGILLELVHRSHVGRALRSARLDDVVARGFGIPVRRYRLAAMVASGALAGLAGALNAHEVGVISPDQYSFTLLVVALTYVVVGGVAYWVGPMVAALALGVFHELMRDVGTDWENITYGLVLIVLILLAPQGLGDPRLRKLFRRRRPKRPAAALQETRT
ncbi:branched-chain amino acid ABC transporter permease [Solirubrobacter ginsenosidimutans]|uniref:Branched-chain amino acid ABC transporter permease n=1 Tax=Solirubrobacter ginsenosidimutans TaxID=490573 RepID=A0A9X3MUY8_9ACTN|nr:branched-chain amino acid ABC transporter permease [Solirubrobacter ginsenosidimutans]MDA0160313.1 branched-chain amino acid ABC transporter permease [Solirubrobacter ginsenosidimutans]